MENTIVQIEVPTFLCRTYEGHPSMTYQGWRCHDYYAYLRQGTLFVLLFILQCAYAVELVTEDGPPYNMYQNGKISGISTDKLTEAFSRINEPLHIQVMPWARAYQTALTLPDYCVYSTARTDERESLFNWVGPLAEMDWVLFSLANNPAKITRLEDLRLEVIGGYRQDVISNWLMEQGYQVDLATTDTINPQKLVKKRFKYWASSKLGATTLIANQGLTGRIVPVFTFHHANLYLACNKATSDSIIKKLNDALQKIHEDGTGARIEARYTN
jgi:polar amino acid transport system substrate-binding protein